MSKTIFAAAFACAFVFAQDSKPSNDGSDDQMTTTASGLKYVVLKAGPEGPRPKRGDHVKVHYKGSLENGVVFDSSEQRGPTDFRIGQVIEGWNEGLKLMTVGSKYKFVVPGELGYGAAGTPDGKIPPNATLVFEVELLDFKEGKLLPEPPKFREIDASKAKTTESGCKYEVTCDGKGKKPGPDDTCAFHFSLFGPDKKLIYATEAAGGKPQKIAMKDLPNQTQLAFLKTTLPEMTEGESRFVEVPASQAFGERGNGQIPGGATTYWEVRLVKVSSPMPLPPFVNPSAAEMTKTASGLQYQVVKEGTGKSPKATDTVVVHYSGWLEDGTNFDSSYSRGDTIDFQLTGVIRGWTEGIQLMKEGGAARLVIPPGLGYGPMGFGQKIPPNATLVFYIELVAVE